MICWLEYIDEKPMSIPIWLLNNSWDSCSPCLKNFTVVKCSLLILWHSNAFTFWQTMNLDWWKPPVELSSFVFQNSQNKPGSSPQQPPSKRVRVIPPSQQGQDYQVIKISVSFLYASGVVCTFHFTWISPYLVLGETRDSWDLRHRSSGAI